MNESETLAHEIDRLVKQVQGRTVAERSESIKRLVKGLTSEGLFLSSEERAACEEYIQGSMPFEVLVAHLASIISRKE